MGSLVSTQSRNVMNYVDQIGDDWSGSSSTRTPRTPSSESPSAETQMQIIMCDANKDERLTLSIGSSTTLKTAFKNYAIERGDSLRSLRFSHRGKALFLSSAGNQTPEQLNMMSGDIITVRGMSPHQESDNGADDTSNQQSTRLPEKVKNIKNRTEHRRSKKKRDSTQNNAGKTLEEWQAQHSNHLSKLHEEVHNRLKEIRTRLHALDIERQLPKQKRRNKQRKKVQDCVDTIQYLSNSWVGGKAGRSSFCIQVGEVQHLYRTNKQLHKSPCRTATAVLDLHGCTREEAFRKLEESLPGWVDAAMRAYPFVMPAKIVCGGGNQILSGIVEQWIRERPQVANAMKTALR